MLSQSSPSCVTHSGLWVEVCIPAFQCFDTVKSRISSLPEVFTERAGLTVGDTHVGWLFSDVSFSKPVKQPRTHIMHTVFEPLQWAVWRMLFTHGVCPFMALELLTKCVGGRHDMPPPCDLDLWPFDLESGVRVTGDVSYLCANFSLPRPLCSRLSPDVRDRQTSDRR